MKRSIIAFAIFFISFKAYAVQDFSGAALKNFKMELQIPESQHDSFLKSQKTHGCNASGSATWRPDSLIQIGDTAQDIAMYSISEGEYIHSREAKIVDVDHLTRVLAWEYTSNFIKLPFYLGTGVTKNPYNTVSCQMLSGSGTVYSKCVDADKETNFDPQVLVEKAEYISKLNNLCRVDTDVFNISMFTGKFMVKGREIPAYLVLKSYSGVYECSDLDPLNGKKGSGIDFKIFSNEALMATFYTCGGGLLDYGDTDYLPDGTPYSSFRWKWDPVGFR